MSGKIIQLESCGSTNTELLRLAEAGIEANTVVVTQHQTAGRGRANHTWVAPAESSLLFSLLLRPKVPLETLPLITVAVGLGTVEGIRSVTSLTPGLKWPNDVLVNGRKCAGILCEGVPPRGDDSPAVVAGIGINVSTPQECLPERPIFPATSFTLEGAAPVDRAVLLHAIVEGILRWVKVLEGDKGSFNVLERFREVDALFGRRLRVSLPDGHEVEGISQGAAPSGALLLQTASGPLEVLAGSLSLAE